jgi:hypothetical protein
LEICALLAQEISGALALQYCLRIPRRSNKTLKEEQKQRRPTKNGESIRQ